MDIHKRAEFEVALRDMAKRFGYEAVELPMIHRDLSASQGGTVLWTVYDSSGSPTPDVFVHFKEENVDSLAS